MYNLHSRKAKAEVALFQVFFGTGKANVCINFYPFLCYKNLHKNGRSPHPCFLLRRISQPSFASTTDLNHTPPGDHLRPPSTMGQTLGRFVGKEWRDEQLRKISDKIFNRIIKQSQKEKLSFEDLYIATLLVYNEINKLLPGPHLDPPSKERIRELIEDSDTDSDLEIDREEFLSFILSLTSDTFISVSQTMVLTLVVAPTVAVATKTSTEGIPFVGKLVQKLPASAYAFLVTVGAVMFQNSQQGL